YQKVVEAIKEAFGYVGGIGVAPTEINPQNAAISLLEELATRGDAARRSSAGESQSMTGDHTTVEVIHDGIRFTIGGDIAFDAGSAELKPEARPDLLKLADLIRGRNNRLVIRGHASGVDRDNTDGLDYRDL